jgi:hypothetical protein
VKKRSEGFCQFLVPKRSSQIVLASSNDDPSAPNRPEDLKLVSLEPSGNEDFEYVLKIVLAREQWWLVREQWWLI